MVPSSQPSTSSEWLVDSGATHHVTSHLGNLQVQTPYQEEEMAEFVGLAIEVVKCVAEPIKRQFNYLCCFNANIQNLRDEATKLDDAKVGVEGQVAAARRNNEVIVPQVETWFDNVNKIQEDHMSGIQPEIQNMKSGCLSIKSRFSLSRKATKMAEKMKKLQDERSGEISHPAPPASMASIPVGQTYELESRKHFEEDIMATLREEKVSMMGIFGMGGVGKTTMAKKIMSRASKAGGEGLFDEIVMVVVSQPVDMLRIQKEIAELLGLELKVESVSARAHELRKRLMNAKSILIILDDLWGKLNLEDLGIPDQRDLKDCTILLTSRNRDVFSAMNIEKTFQMKILNDEEAWSLFKEKVGARVDDPSLLPTAHKIVQECNGLPLALVTVGVALKDKIDKSIWENAVHELKSCHPEDIQDFLAHVYNPLKLSYDLLESENAKLIFLMCCLFPEDNYIRIYDLSLYAWGLRMFEGITSLQAMRNKVQASVSTLKSRSLLLHGPLDEYTKMHDIVRDVGIYIATKKELMDPNLNWPREESNYNVTWISLFHQQLADKFTLPGGSVFPNLRFFRIQGPYSPNRHSLLIRVAHSELSVYDNFFESVRNLHVLSIHHYVLRSLPHTIQLLENIRTLIFYGCESLEDISVVGELTSLEILYCDDCDSIKELPVEIGRLNKLKLLHFSYCRSLSRIAAGVISSLTTLEELTLIRSFSNWEWGGSEGKNAALCEINSLSNLTTLKIHIMDDSLAAEQIHLSSNLVEFSVEIGLGELNFESYGREMSLYFEKEVIIGDWIHQLLRTTERLHLEGEGSSKLLPFLPECQRLKWLRVQDSKLTRLTAFPLLEFLNLWYIDSLEEIHKGPISSESFNNLSYIKIMNCRSLRSLFSCAMENNYLLRLKSLTIWSCPMLEQVMFRDIGQNSRDHHPVIFPELEELSLSNLPMLTNLCKGIDNIDQFPALNRMEIKKCPSLKSLVSGAVEDHGNDDSLHLICKPEAAFGRLEYLTIDGYDSICSIWCDKIPIDFFTRLVDLTVCNCGNIKSLFSLSIARNLINLIRLRIKSCGEMVKVIEGEDVERSSFIKLKVLRLEKLPKLKVFCEWRCVLELPSLREVYISECPEMERFSFGSLTTPNLKDISIDREDISDYTKDLNDALFGGNFLHLEILFGSD
ncbi:hypothetical protein ACS0TY_025272 [Phlomoides rotata]